MNQPLKRIICLLFAVLTLALCACNKDNADEIVAVSQYSIEKNNAQNAEAAGRADEPMTASLTGNYLFAAAPETFDAVPNVILSRGKGGPAPSEAKNYSWYFNDTAVFDEYVGQSVTMSGIEFSIEKTHVKNLSDTKLQKEINTWIDTTFDTFMRDKALPGVVQQLKDAKISNKVYIYQNNYCSNGILSIEIQMDVFPNVVGFSMATYTCDLATGKQLTLGDLFYEDFDYLNYFNRRIVEQVLSPGFFEVDFSELKRPFSGITENHADFTVSGSSVNIYFPFGNDFFSTGATVSVPIEYNNYAFSDPTRKIKFTTSESLRKHCLIENNGLPVTSFKSVDTENNVNLSSIRFATGDKKRDEELNTIIISAEASMFSPVLLRQALSDHLSPEEASKYRIDVAYLQSTLLGGRLLMVEYQISSVSAEKTLLLRRTVCIDTVKRASFTFADIIPPDLPWSKKAAVISSTYYNIKQPDLNDILSITLKKDGTMLLTFRVNDSSAINEAACAVVSVDGTCFDWNTYVTY